MTNRGYVSMTCEMCWYNLNLRTLCITLLILWYQFCTSISGNYSKVLHL